MMRRFEYAIFAVLVVRNYFQGPPKDKIAQNGRRPILNCILACGICFSTAFRQLFDRVHRGTQSAG
jgi:hypothetical protein